MCEVHFSVVVSKVGLSRCEVEGDRKRVVRDGSSGRGFVLLPYQDGPVCRCNVDWDKEEVAIKTWAIWSFEEASMVPGDSVVIVRELNHFKE